MIMGRRAFLTNVAAVAVFPALPQIAMTEPVAVAEALKPATTIWVGGHNGEFDWHPFNAESREDAIKELLNYFGPDYSVDGEPYTIEDADLCLERAKEMDGLEPEQVKPYHWILAGFGASCDRCGSECFAPDGARAIAGEAVCEECLTIPDLLEGDDYDQEDAEDRLKDWFIGHDCDEASVRKQMSRSFDPDLIPTDVWQKCLAEARAAL
ncbi:hypothetical protein [Rhizobium gallicum]|uniref:hypothetical protein n=1 Tax=Rhizobium gallicum TaxID=56730 RepID=UPI00036319D5